MIHFPLAASAQRYRRLRYRYTDGQQTLRLAFTYTHPSSPQTPDIPAAEPENVDSWQAQLDALLAKHEQAEAGQEEVADPASSVEAPEVASEEAAAIDAEAPLEDAELHIDAQLESCVETDLLLPDRPVDARCTVRSITSLPDGAVSEWIARFFSDALGNQDNQARRNNAVRPLTTQSSLPGQEGLKFELEGDEEVEVMEVASSEEPGVVLRTVRSRDMMLNIERWSEYTEVSFLDLISVLGS